MPQPPASPLTAIRNITRARVASVLEGDGPDPLRIAIAIASDEDLDARIRLEACSLVIPVMYPRLAASVVAVGDAAQRASSTPPADLIGRLQATLARIALPEPAIPATIEAVADPDPVPDQAEIGPSRPELSVTADPDAQGGTE